MQIYFLKDGRVFPGIKRYIIKEFGDIKFAVTGLLTTRAVIQAREKSQQQLSGLNDLLIEPPVKALEDVMAEARNQGAQRFILLSHLGIDEDASLCEKVDGLDVVISGHSHSMLPQPISVKNALIVSSGMKGKYIGSLTLNIADVISMKISK